MKTVIAAARIVSAFVSAASLGACTSFEGYPREPETPSQIDISRDIFFGPKAADNYNTETDPSKRKADRDYLIYGKMGVIERDFDDLERALVGTGNSVSIFGDLAVLGLNGYATVSGGKSTKAALSAAAGGIVGAQGAISKDLYYQRTLPAILAQMEANRERVRAEIIASMAKPDTEYPLPAAEIDLRRLIRAGSVPSSISEITQGANESKRSSEQTIEGLRNLSFSTSPSSARMAAWLRPNGKVDAARTTAFENWIKAQPDAAVLTSVSFYSILGGQDSFAEAVRQRALADPTLAIPK